MFKKGQLIQSVKYGDYYVVESAGPTGSRTVPVRPKRPGYQHMWMEDKRVRLIGNNYQAKPKCSR